MLISGNESYDTGIQEHDEVVFTAEHPYSGMYCMSLTMFDTTLFGFQNDTFPSFCRDLTTYV